MRKTNTSEYYRSIDKAKRYEVIADSPVSHGKAGDSDDEQADVAVKKEEKRVKEDLQLSEIKSRHWQDKIRMLEEEK